MIDLSRASNTLYNAAFKPIIDHTGSFLSNRVVVTALKFSAPMLAIVLLVEGVTKAMKKMGYHPREARVAPPSRMFLEPLAAGAFNFTMCHLLSLSEKTANRVILFSMIGATTKPFMQYSAEKLGYSHDSTAVTVGDSFLKIFLSFLSLRGGII